MSEHKVTSIQKMKVENETITMSLTSQNMQEMVRNLGAAWRGQSPIELPTSQYGMISLKEAYLIQDALSKELTRDFGEVIGYKVAFTKAQEHKKFGITEPVTGRLFQKQLVEDHLWARTSR